MWDQRELEQLSGQGTMKARVRARSNGKKGK